MKKMFAIIMLFAASVAAENQPIIEIGRVETQEVTTPIHETADGADTIQVSGMPLEPTGRKDWFRVFVHYRTTPKWIDRLTLEFYVLMPSPEKEKVLFKGAVNYVDIPEGRDHLAEMYMHFNTYARHYGYGEIQTAVIAKINGKIVGIDEKNSLDNPWWEDKQAFKCGLLNRLDTPFRVINMELYESQDPCVWQ